MFKSYSSVWSGQRKVTVSLFLCVAFRFNLTLLQFDELQNTQEGLKTTNEKVVKKYEEEEGKHERDEKWFPFWDMDTQHGYSLKQPKLLLTTVWPTERFQQLDSIRGFLKGGRPHPHCMSHFLIHIHTKLDLGWKKELRSNTSIEAGWTFELSLHGAEHHSRRPVKGYM